MWALLRSDIATLSHLDTQGANPGWPFLLIKAVLSPPGNCAGIPPARRVPLCPIPSPLSPNSPTFTTPRAQREQTGGSTGLQLCPYSQHLTRGPDVHAGNSNNLSNASPQWDPAPANVSLLSHMTAHQQAEQRHIWGGLIYSIRSDQARPVNWYCTISISSVHQTKAIKHLAQIRWAVR